MFVVADTICALGKKEEENGLRKVEVSGRVRMVGNSPNTFLVLSGKDREWYIESGEQKKLTEFQQQAVTVRAYEYYYDIFFANGSPAGRHYYLKNITVISR